MSYCAEGGGVCGEIVDVVSENVNLVGGVVFTAQGIRCLQPAPQPRDL